MTRFARWAAGPVVVALLGTAASGLAARPPSKDPVREDTEKGRASFLVYCGGCHGEDGRGKGAAARSLETAPPDLTRLAARNGGAFPEERIRASIDGRGTTTEHASREMPAWGLDLRQLDSDRDQEDEVREKIRQLVLYLRSIQRTND
jgi:mono/diheme cytochrome c family protein